LGAAVRPGSWGERTPAFSTDLRGRTDSSAAPAVYRRGQGL